ncbi:MAG: PSD1 and planctomycete cytochrome C domain-containing protein [Bythopirellula sp.]
MRSLLLALSITVCGWIDQSFAADLTPANKAFFHQQIEPILVGRCLECHGEAAKGDLDLRTRATSLDGGDSGQVIVPGSADESLLYEHVSSQKMPPKRPLSTQQVAAIKLWINRGLYFPEQPIDRYAITTDHRAGFDWWSLQPLATHSPPRGRASDSAHPIDRFVHAKLATQGLEPSPPAEPRRLIRRATYDLIGLPPTPEEVDRFVSACGEETGSDNLVGEQAYEQLLDGLLSSDHYGEHWGSHWLDVVRFGESNGFERNVIHNNVWPFRDYVIRSFNDDKPFDRLVLEHLAGDVLGREDPDVAVGTAFLVCGPYDNVGNQDAQAAAQIRADTIDEFIRATSEAFLGLTVGCSRCHDHKFDPISQRDYYRMYASLAGVKHGERAIRTKRSKGLTRELDIVKKQIDDIEQRLQAYEPLARVDTGKAQQTPLAENSPHSVVAQQHSFRRAVRAKLNIERIAPVEAKYVRFTIVATNSAQPCIDELEIYTAQEKNAPPKNIAAASAGGIASSSGNYAGDPKHRLSHVNDGEFGNAKSWISDQQGAGWVQIEFAEPQRIDRIVWGRDRQIKYTDRLATSYQIQVAAASGAWQTVASSADRLPQSAGPDAPEACLSCALPGPQAAMARSLQAQLRALSSRADQLASAVAPPRWWIGNFTPAPGPFHVFLGGDPQRQGAKVTPSSIDVLGPSIRPYQLQPDAPEDQRRLALAEWIVADDNPLTPRVLANRLWHYHFGLGIVSTPSDLGFLGSPPSHPKLLDWLAVELKENNWQLKPLHKMIMQSRTYRQASDFRSAAASLDHDNRLLWRFPPRRLSAEEIRDSALMVAGKLAAKMGGPGFRLFRYVQDNVATYHPLDKHGPETYRRAVYHHNARAMQIDLMSEFDKPDCAFPAPRRSSTTTPMQALTLMNHSFTLDMARALAERLDREVSGGDLPGQVDLAFQLAFARLPHEDETAASLNLIESHGLPAFCRALLNTSEFIYIE